MCNSLQPDGLGKVLTRSEEKGTASGEETNSKWPMVPLGEVLAQYKEYIECPEPKVYQKLSVKLYGKGVILDTPTDGTALKMKRHQIAKAGQVILSEIWGKKGAIGFVPPEGDGALCTSHFFLFEFNPGRIDQKYLQAIFAANYLQDQLDAEAKGTTGYAAVRPKILFDAKIPLPPLDEQRRIVARIEELAARIEEAREMRRRAVEEADVLMNKCSEYLFDNKDCNTRSIESICEVKGGIQKSSERAPGANPRRYITVAHVQRNRIDISDPRYFEVSEEELEKWRLLPGDVLVIEGNGSADQIGRTALFCGEIDDCVHQNHVIRIRPNQTRVLPDYLNGFLNSPLGQKEMRERSRTTSGLFNLSVGRIKSIDVPLPAFNDQRLIVERIHDLQSKFDLLKRHQAETATELDALLPTVLERAFRGEL